MLKYTKNALFSCAWVHILTWFLSLCRQKGVCTFCTESTKHCCVQTVCLLRSFHFISYHFFHSILVNVNKSPLEISLAYLYFTATKFLFYFWDSSWCSSAFWDCESQAKWYVVNMKHRKNSRRRRRRDDRKTWDNWNGRKGCCWYMCVQCCWLRKWLNTNLFSPSKMTFTSHTNIHPKVHHFSAFCPVVHSNPNNNKKNEK